MNNILLTCIVFAGFVILSLIRGRHAFIPVHMSSKEYVTELKENATYNEKYRYAMTTTLDLFWVMKTHIIEIREYHRRITIFDQRLIEFITDLLDELQEYVNLLADITSQVLRSSEHILPGQNFNPLNETIFDRLVKDWALIKSHIESYQPAMALKEHDEMCKVVNRAIRELRLQYKPIHELMMNLHNVTDDISEDERARRAKETTIISLFY